MNLAFVSFRLKNQLISVISPSWTARKIQTLFITPRRSELKFWEQKGEQQGARFDLTNELSAIRWLPTNGVSNGKKILLVHGWESRATQMFALVPVLLKSGYEVVAIDQYAHGLSTGAQSHVMEFVNGILEAQKVEDDFEVVIAHSIGATASATAISKGLQTNKLVLIFGPSSVENVLRRFSQLVGLNQRATNYFVHLMETLTGTPVKALDTSTLLMKSPIHTLLIHDNKDKEIPVSESERLHQSLDNSELVITSGFGHRKILKSEIVHGKIIEFISHGKTEEAQSVIIAVSGHLDT